MIDSDASSIWNTGISIRSRLRFRVAGTERTSFEVLVDPRLHLTTLINPTSIALDWGLAVSQSINDKMVVSIQITDNFLSWGNGYPLDGIHIGLAPRPSANLTVFIPPNAHKKRTKKRQRKNQATESNRE